MEFIGKTKIDFLGKRSIAFLISGIISIVGIVGIIQIARNEANMGIDFSGGAEVQLKFAQPVVLDKAREALVLHGIKDAHLQEIIDGNNTLLIKLGKAGTASESVADRVTGIFRKEFPDNGFVVESSSEIGPSIGEKLKKDTLSAIGISMVGIIIYIAWRFDLKFGIGAILSTLHDVLAMFAVFYVMGKEINLLFITAVLTIAGYSLTDTVVIFDRIRENLGKDLHEPVQEVFNRSVNEVLSRTVITSLTTLMAAMSLLLFGGDVIRDFAFALVVGIVFGTYSSIFVATPVVFEWDQRYGRAKA